MLCPRCAFDSAGAIECGKCGLIFARLKPARILQRREDPTRIVIIGLVAASVVFAIPFARFVFSAIVTLFHELGHAIAGWALGYPSLPAFDLTYGGGITHMGEFRLPVAIAAGCAIAFAAWRWPEKRIAIAILAAIWLIAVTKEWRREVVFAAAGHATELILATVFLYRAFSGTGWRNPALERPLGVFVGFFVQINSAAFAWQLLHDAAFLDVYREGKGGAMMHDLEVIALDLNIYLGLTPGIEGGARLLFLASLLPALVAYVWWRRATSRETTS